MRLTNHQINIESAPFEPKRNRIFADETLLGIACAVIIFVASVYASFADDIGTVQLIPDTNIQK